MSLLAADLFAGAGGLSEGAESAGVRVIWSANHWPDACAIYALNHGRDPVCQDLQQFDFHALPDIDLLLAAPACQGHSPARGKDRPRHDATRSTAWAVISALEAKRPAFALVENVPAFARWQLFPAWCSAAHALGYAIAPHEVDAADHGVPQHRARLFLALTRSRHPVALELPRRAHVPAADIIDFGAGAWSAIGRKGRSQSTLARIAAGRRRFGERFVAPYYGSGSGETGRSLQRPLGTITTRDRWAVIDGDRMRMLSIPEARAAMGFPDTYQLPKAKHAAMHMLGNAVCPPVARDLVSALVAA